MSSLSDKDGVRSVQGFIQAQALLESNQIIDIFNNMIKDIYNMNHNDFENKYKNFKNQNPKIYDLAIDSVVSNKVQENLNMLNLMLKSRDNMNNGNISKLNSDFYIGNQLGKKYIYPKTGTPSQQDYIRAIGSISKKDETE